MEDKMKALMENITWILVPKPHVSNVVGSKWIFKIKYKEDGTIDRYKACLVAQDYSQVQGIDYEETYNPMVKHTTIRLILSLATSASRSIKQLDVNNAFLHGHLKEDIYMSQPPGFVNPCLPNHVCKLQKLIYGLKQAPRAWFDRLANFLHHIAFTCSKADPSLFILKNETILILMLVYVDDIILTGNSVVFVQQLVELLGTELALKDLGALHYFLGIEVKSTNKGLMITQGKYARDLLQKANMIQASHITTPMGTSSQSQPHDEQSTNVKYYRSIVGSLQYLTLTRLDITQAVNKVCQQLQNPTVKDLKAVKRILRYIKGTTNHGIMFYKNSSTNLYGFCDADWGGCPITRLSTTGYCIFLGANCISWFSKKQPTVARSSSEAEYRAMASTTVEITWITFLLRDIGIALHTAP